MALILCYNLSNSGHNSAHPDRANCCKH